MRPLPTLALLAALVPSLAWISPAGAQPVRPTANLSLAQAERNAADLKQGMSLDEVQRLLGKPRRTAFRSNGSSTNVPVNGTLHWTYTWTGSSSSPGTLHVEFAAKKPDAWYVNSWDWAAY